MLTTNFNKLSQDTVWVVTWNDGSTVETRDMEATRLQARVTGRKIIDTWIKDNFYIVIKNHNKYFSKSIVGKEKARNYVNKVRKSGGKITACMILTTTQSKVKAGEYFRSL